MQWPSTVLCALPITMSARKRWGAEQNPEMVKGAKQIALSLRLESGSEMLNVVDKNAQLFYKYYTDYCRPMVERIPRSDSNNRKRAKNNITGGAGRLKKDFTVLILKSLLDRLLDEFRHLARSFSAAFHVVQSETELSDELGATIHELLKLIHDCECTDQARAIVGSSIHDAIDENARREGDLASTKKSLEKLAEASGSPGCTFPKIEDCVVDAMSIIASRSSPSDVSLPVPLVSSRFPTSPAPLGPVDFSFSMLTGASHPAADVLTSQVNHSNLEVPPKPSWKKHAHFKLVPRSVKNNAAATRTNHTRKGRVNLYRDVVAHYANIVAAIRDATFVLYRATQHRKDRIGFICAA